MAECNREDAEKAYQLAEESFLAGNVPRALRLARKAQRLLPSLPGVANALAAYGVHVAAAAAASTGGTNRYVVLGLDPSSCHALTQDAIKKQYRRQCLRVHPDKNSSTAAEGAFKLVQEAWDALSVWHQPSAAAPAAQPRADATTSKGSSSSARQQPAGEADGDDNPAPRRIYCRHCNSEFTRRHVVVDELGVPCPRCGRRLKPPWDTKPKAPKQAPREAPPAPRPKPPLYPCPSPCPHCGAQYASMVFAGLWQLQCRACGKRATVHVLSPTSASCCPSRQALAAARRHASAARSTSAGGPA